jgi:hypothetical protein
MDYVIACSIVRDIYCNNYANNNPITFNTDLQIYEKATQ